MDSRFIHKLIAAALLKEDETKEENKPCPECGSTSTETDLNWIDGKILKLVRMVQRLRMEKRT